MQYKSRIPFKPTEAIPVWQGQSSSLNTYLV